MTESKDTKQKLLKKQDMILIAVILAAAVLLFLGAKLMHKSPAEIVEVSVDGKVVATLDLAKDQELTIASVSGGTHHLIIKDREASPRPHAPTRSVSTRERSIWTARSSSACPIR